LINHGANGWLFDLEEPRSFHLAVTAILSEAGLKSGWRVRRRAGGR